jgi:P4 family phage/plasmid primase-like protien
MSKKKAAPSAQWPASFTDKDRATFERFRIPAKLVVDAGVMRVTDGEARKYRILGRGDMSGLLFPYADLRTEAMVTCRVRRDNPATKNGKPEAKYMMPPADKAPRILYFPPGTKEKLERRRDVVFVLVEAEKSALALTAWAERRGCGEQLVPVAMGGCWGWSQDKAPLPDFAEFEGRTVYVLLDANVASNGDVRDARDSLVAALRSLSCEVSTLQLPQMDGVNGPDDLVAQPDGDELMAKVFAGRQNPVVAPYSEHALAARLNAEKQDALLFVPTQGWLTWANTHWQYDEKGEAEMATQALCEQAASERAKPQEQNRIRSRHTREAVQREAQPLFSRVNVKGLDKDTMLQGTPGKTVDLRSGALREPQREDYITKLTAVSPDAATAPKRWLRFLDEITNKDKELQTYLQRVFGYCLTGDTSEHVLFFLYGTGANGKSVFVNTLLGILGDYGAVAPMEMFTVSRTPQGTSSLAALRGARLVAATETEAGSRWAEAKLKAITGGDPITARFLYQNDFTYTPQFKLMLSGNHKPRLHNVDEAMQRRIHLIPFVVTIPANKRDKNLPAELRKEWPGILQWAVEGCLAWQREGLRAPQAVLAATKDYFEQQDVLGQFLDAATVSVKNAKMASGDLYLPFKRYADERGEFVYPQKEFSQKLEDRGYTLKKTNGVRCIVGLRLKTAAELAAAKAETAAASERERKFAGPKVVPMAG